MNFREYCEHGWVLCAIPAGAKKPLTKGWNERGNCITDPGAAEHLDAGAGLCHAYSLTCVVDIDDAEKAGSWLAERGIDLADLLDSRVQILSGREGRAKLLFQAPGHWVRDIAGQPQACLPSFALPGLELRCATRSFRTVQDVLPPSIHPDTKQPYEWRGDWRHLPQLPPAILALWESLIGAETKPVAEPRETKIPASEAYIRERIGKRDPDDYHEWIQVGQALHLEFGGDQRGLELWDEWSEQSSKYLPDVCARKWATFTSDSHPNPISLASFREETAAEDHEFRVIPDDEAEAFEARLERERAKPKALVARERDEARVGEVMRQLRRNDAGAPIVSLSNINLLLGAEDICGHRIARDRFKDQILVAPVGTTDWRPIRDTDMTSFRMWLEDQARMSHVAKELARDAVHYIAEQNEMDSAQEWLAGLSWDGTPRIERFFIEYLGTDDTPYERAVGLYTWSALAMRVLEPGCQADMMPVLYGEQGLQKTKAVKAIAPHPEFFAEVRMSDEDDKLSRKIRGVLVCEVAELDGLRSAELSRIKAMITRTHERWRPLFGEFMTTFPRRCLWIGTTNEQEFLPNDDAHRRWLPLSVQRCDYDGIKRDCTQLWAEAAVYARAHGVAWEKAEELARPQHEKYAQQDHWEVQLEKYVSESKGEGLTTTEILEQAVGMDLRRTGRIESNRVAKLMRARGYELKNRHGAKRWVRR